jgi:hypothetical protein
MLPFAVSSNKPSSAGTALLAAAAREAVDTADCNRFFSTENFIVQHSFQASARRENSGNVKCGMHIGQTERI